MSTISLQDLSYISREDLAQRMRASHNSSSTTEDAPGGLPEHIAVVDVRDSDHVGGHIRGSTWLPSHELDYKTPELIRTMKDKDVVVFHCALSQQRGPSAALRYLREKERLEGVGQTGSKGVVEEKGAGVDKDGKDAGKEGKKQQVVVLRGGFTEWQEKFGRDERLTEGWKKDIWEDGS
jgi:rhodanese-related sulfurtransferase